MRQRDAEELSRSAVGVLGAFQDFVRRPVGQGDAVDVAAQAKHVQHRCAGVADEAHRRVGHGRDLADGKTLRRRRQRRVAVGGDELIERREDLRRMLYGRAFAPAPEASTEALLFQQDLIVQTDGRRRRELALMFRLRRRARGRDEILDHRPPSRWQRFDLRGGEQFLHLLLGVRRRRQRRRCEEDYREEASPKSYPHAAPKWLIDRMVRDLPYHRTSDFRRRTRLADRNPSDRKAAAVAVMQRQGDRALAVDQPDPQRIITGDEVIEFDLRVDVIDFSSDPLA